MSPSFPQGLVEGRFPKHRGLLLGRVVRLDPPRGVYVRRESRQPTGGAALGRPALTAAASAALTAATPQGRVSSPLPGYLGVGPGAGPEAVDEAAGKAGGPGMAEVVPRPGMGVVLVPSGSVPWTGTGRDAAEEGG